MPVMSGRFSTWLEALCAASLPATSASRRPVAPAAPDPAVPAFDPHALALDLFNACIAAVSNIGVAELLALHRAFGGTAGARPVPDDLAWRLVVVQFPRQEQAEFDRQWRALAAYWAAHPAARLPGRQALRRRLRRRRCLRGTGPAPPQPESRGSPNAIRR